MTAPRYQVVPRSQTGHCCFEWTVVDTTRLLNAYRGDKRFIPMCECWDEADARQIADALNRGTP